MNRLRLTRKSTPITLAPAATTVLYVNPSCEQDEEPYVPSHFSGLSRERAVADARPWAWRRSSSRCGHARRACWAYASWLKATRSVRCGSILWPLFFRCSSFSGTLATWLNRSSSSSSQRRISYQHRPCCTIKHERDLLQHVLLFFLLNKDFCTPCWFIIILRYVLILLMFCQNTPTKVE